MAQTPYTPKAQETRNKTVVERYFHEASDRNSENPGASSP